MHFSKGVSFNTHDTSVEKGRNGRIQINRQAKGGVKHRCELALNSVIRFYQGATASKVATDLNRRLQANYSHNDIRHALDRLSVEGIVKATRGGRGEDTVYRATKAALHAWRKLPKA
jgi:hypothetical protein